ncbi:MAG TPA: condensation domain-containing protein, partial [Phycisphaerae bacterium]|nr:condensation domain-containing protein [Phycisphaerae bacterium]
MRHDSPLIAAVLGILKTGRIVVVLNPTDPPVRLRQVLDDAEPVLIITDSLNSAVANQIVKSGCKIIFFEEHSAESDHNPEIQISPKQTAFLVYTSGSTGLPKGVMKTHRCVQHNAYRLTRSLELHAQDRIILLASLSGGQGIATMSCALLNGATLYPFPVMDKGVNGLADLLMKHHISVFISAVSVFRHFTRTLNDKTLFPDVKVVQFASETATANDFASWRKHFSGKCFLLHTLSSSETGTTTQQRFNHHEVITDGPLPIGRATPGVEILLCDQNGREVRDSETGEIIVKSVYISPGYWRNDPMTAERFSQSGDNSEPKVFRSGDLGRRNSNGQITFVGRKGARVKIRGYRIETSEIERVLLSRPEIEKAVVGLHESPDHDPQLVAYIVLHSGFTCTVDKLRHALRSTLPSQMVPAFFVFLDKFPLTPHGKVDRDSLRRIDPPMTRQIQKPATEMEKLLADIWSEVFHRPMIGRDGHFFDLGGDSLTAAVIAARIGAATNVEMDLRLFTDHPTLADLAKVIEGLRHIDRVDHLPRLTRASREAPLPVSFAQERVLKHSQALDVPTAYTMASSNFIKGDLNVEILQESLNHLLGRHEILRTNFDYIGGKPVQIIHPTQTLPLHLLDLTAAPKEKKNVLEILQKESRRAFDLKQEPLVRMILVRILRDEHYLLRISHHIISDAWSWQVFFQELAQVYEAKLRGAPTPFPEFEPLQYGDFAVWQRNVLNPDGETYKNEVLWWKKLFAEKARQFTLPFRRSKKLETADSSESTIWWGLDAAISQKLNHIGFEQNVTYYAIRLAAFAALLAKKTGQPDVAIGTYITNRNQVETHKIFGYFANPAVLRLHCDMNQTFLDWLGVVRKIVSEAQANSKIPYEQLCDELRKQGVNPPEILAIFSVSTHTAPISLGDAVMTWNDRWIQGMPWGFTLAFDQFNEAHRCRASFDTRLYDPLLVRAFVEQYIKFLDAASCNPNLPIAELLAISKPEPESRQNNNIYSKILRKFSLGLPKPPGRSAQIVKIRSQHVTQQDGVYRKNLPLIESRSPQQVQMPATETETLLANIWSDVLGRPSIGRNDHFFDLGGDSLSATVIAARIHAAINVQMDLRVFTDHPTLADLAGIIDSLRNSDRMDNLPRLSRTLRDAHLPLSFAQERVLKYSQTAEASARQTMATSLHIHGPVNRDILRESMNYMVLRHEILRTTFDNIDGKPVQIVHPFQPEPLPLSDFSGMPDAENRAIELLQKEALARFDLTRGPLLRFLLVRIREDEHRLLNINHHIISDGWSWKVYFHELGLIYEARLRGETPPLPEFEPLQYGDYAAWERRVLDPAGTAYCEKVQWWKNLFSDNPHPTVLPFKERKPIENADPSQGFMFWGLNASISQRLDRLGREQGATYFVMRLAAFVALLAAETRKPDVIIGINVSNRHDLESQKMFGFFANMAMLRLNCKPTQTFLEWVHVVRKMVGETQARSDIPYEQLCEELRKQGVHPPKICAIFSVSIHTAPVRFGGLVLTWHERCLAGMPWGFITALDQYNENHRCRTTFDARIYNPVLVRAFTEKYVRLLDAASYNPNLTITELLAISKPEPKSRQNNNVYTKLLDKLLPKKPGKSVAQ